MVTLYIEDLATVEVNEVTITVFPQLVFVIGVILLLPDDNFGLILSRGTSNIEDTLVELHKKKSCNQYNTSFGASPKRVVLTLETMKKGVLGMLLTILIYYLTCKRNMKKKNNGRANVDAFYIFFSLISVSE